MNRTHHTTALPAREQAARRNRHGILLLPSVPSLNPPPAPKPRPHTGRKTERVVADHRRNPHIL